MARVACLLLLCAATACGSVSRPFDDDGGITHDAGVDDAQVFDAAPDAEPPDASPPPGAARDLVGGAGRATGATYTLDVEVGHPLGQGPSTSTTYTMEGNAAIKP